MKKFAICILLTVFCQVAFGQTVAHWNFEEGSGPLTVNLDGDPNLALQLGVHMTNPRQDPAWCTVDGVSCVDFDNYNLNGQAVFCKNVAGTWGTSQFSSIVPTGSHTYEMIFNLQSIAPTAAWDNDSPWTLMEVVDKTYSRWYYSWRFSNAKKIQYTVNSVGSVYVETNGTDCAITPGKWYYLSVSYIPSEPNEMVMRIRDIYTGREVAGVQQSWSGFPEWPADADGRFALGSEVTGTGTFRRSSNVLISEVRVTNGVVIEKDELWQSWPLLVEDYQFYADDTELLAVWEDSTSNGSGATISLTTGDYYLTPNGMKLDYIGESVTTRVYTEDQDWDRNNLKVIDLPFYGIEGNSTTETLYVTVEDADGLTATVNYPNSADLGDKGWHIWNLSLADFSGIDLTRVSKFSIGLTGGTGSGYIYVDDIRIYPCRAQQEADLNRDCVVDTADFAQMAQDWLAEGLH